MNTKKTLLLSFASLFLCLLNTAFAVNKVQQIRSNSMENKVQIVIDTTEKSGINAFSLSKPERLVIDVDGQPTVDFINNLTFQNRGISVVRTGVHDGGKLRVVLELVKNFRWKAFTIDPKGNDGHRIVIDVFDYAGKTPVRKRKNTKKVMAAQVAKIAPTPAPYFENYSAPPRQAPQTSNNYFTAQSSSAIAKNVGNSSVNVNSSSGAPVIFGLDRNMTTEQMVENLNVRSASVSQGQVGYPEPALTQATAMRSTYQSEKPPLTFQSNPVDYPTAQPIIQPQTQTQSEIQFTPSVSEQLAPLDKGGVSNGPRKRHHRDLVIMIDPGHGGKDSGAVGPAGTKESMIVLQISKRLKRKIDAMPGMRAVLTRSTNRYITLRGRLALARRHKPDLFVSVHADGAKNRAARGSSVYVLSTRGASSEAAKILAQNENAVDSKYGIEVVGVDDEVGDFMVKMQQDVTIETSHALAKTTLRQLKGIGAVHKRLVERAGFAVLKSPHIPSMLVETAFISNHQEEQKLKSPNYQDQLATAIAKGIKAFFDSHATQSEMVVGAQ